jgi:RPAP1-like, C-terminal/RPAP1-like, N-terminal
MADDPPPGTAIADDDPLVAEQNAFLSDRSRPAARVIRSSAAAKKEDNAPGNVLADEQAEDAQTGPDWYRSMRGVRFQLDNLEDQEGNTLPRQSAFTEKQESGGGGMGQALMGDIVERKTSKAPPVFAPRGSTKIAQGFPAPRTLRRPKASTQESPKAPASKVQPVENGQGDEKSMMEDIDRENTKKIEQMSEDEILKLQKSLQESLSPSTLDLLRKLPPKPTPLSAHAPPVPSAPPKTEDPTPQKTPKKVSFDGLDDQAFDSHLRSFFPSETAPQPEWTIPVHPAEETFYSTPSDTNPQANIMRFDLKGKYIPPATARTLPTHLGLHHHALDPGSAGYTLAELSILARSMQPSQKCIALKTVGVVLADVAGGKYEWDVQEELWEEIERERIVEILLDVARSAGGGNRSVARYAEDAVSRWVDAGGPKLWEERLRKRGFEMVDTNEGV